MYWWLQLSTIYFQYARMRNYCMQVRTCSVWNWYGIVEFHLRLQFYSIPFLVETPSLTFSTHSLFKVPNSRIIPTLTFQFQSPARSGDTGLYAWASCRQRHPGCHPLLLSSVSRKESVPSSSCSAMNLMVGLTPLRW